MRETSGASLWSTGQPIGGSTHVAAVWSFKPPGFFRGNVLFFFAGERVGGGAIQRFDGETGNHVTDDGE